VARWSIAGLWRGRYAYAPGEAYRDPPPAVSFTLELERGWLGRFSGRVQDDPGRGPPEPGFVKGRVVGDRVQFRKWLPVFYVQDAGRLITLRDYLRRVAGLTLEEDLRPPPVYYRGAYCAVTERVAGSWEMPPEVLQFTSQGRAYEWPLAGVTGTWDMERLSSQGQGGCAG
jgi:hypothetical protein